MKLLPIALMALLALQTSSISLNSHRNQLDEAESHDNQNDN